MNIVMYGPGDGHNIEIWLKYFNTNTMYKLFFIYYGDKSSFDAKYSNIEFIKIDSYIIIQKKFKKTNIELLILHGAYNIIQTFMMQRIISSKMTILIPWGNNSLDRIPKLPILKKAIVYKIYKSCNHIVATPQYINRMLTVMPFTKKSAYEFVWGIDSEYMIDQDVSISDFTRSFLNSIGDKFFIFWPRSISKISRFDLVIHALNLLKTKTDISNILFVIWSGNEIDSMYKDELESIIEEYDLVNTVKIILHPFLAINDMIKIWNRANLTFNLIEHDNFSTQIGEAFVSKTQILMSNIESYNLVEKKYNQKFEYISHEPQIIAKRLLDFIQKKEIDYKSLNELNIFARNHLNCTKNIESLLNNITWKKSESH